jgi:hypothetical protein
MMIDKKFDTCGKGEKSIEAVPLPPSGSKGERRCSTYSFLTSALDGGVGYKILVVKPEMKRLFRTARYV